MNKVSILFAAGLLSFATVGGVLAQQQAEKKDLELTGYHDLHGRGAYQPVIHEQGGRWIAYVGHHGGTALNPLTGAREPSGTSIIDVSNPAHPRYLHHIPGEPGGGAQMVRACKGSDLPRADRGNVTKGQFLTLHLPATATPWPRASPFWNNRAGGINRNTIVDKLNRTCAVVRVRIHPAPRSYSQS